MVVTHHAGLMVVMVVAPVVMVVGESRCAEGDDGGDQRALDKLLHLGVPLCSPETGRLTAIFDRRCSFRRPQKQTVARVKDKFKLCLNQNLPAPGQNDLVSPTKTPRRGPHCGAPTPTPVPLRIS